MAKTYMSEVPQYSSCDTPYCGGIHKYFCVRCRHFVIDCRCTPGTCNCDGHTYWASKGERPALRALLAATNKATQWVVPDMDGVFHLEGRDASTDG